MQTTYQDDAKRFLFQKYSTALAPRKNSQQFDQTDYTFAIDESSSITIENYRIITSCCKKQVEVMDFDGDNKTPKTRVSVFTFNETVVQALDCCSDRQAVLNCLNNLPYRGGGTNAKLALEKAYQHIQNKNTPKTHNVLIYLTDGDLGHSSNIIQKIITDSSISIKLAVIFMNFPVPQDIYSKYGLQEYQVVHFKDYTIMENVYNFFAETKASIKPEIEHISMSTTTARLYLSVPKSEFPLDYFLYEVYDDNLSKVIKTGRAQFDEVLIDGLQPGTPYRVRVRAIYKNGVKSDWMENQKILTYSKVAIIEWLKDKELTIQKHQELLEKLPAAKVHMSLKQMGHKQLNILLLGPMGHGKSSFVNTAASTFASEYCTPSLTQLNPNKTCTTVLKEVDILAYQNQKKNNYLHFMDSFGIRHNRDGQAVPTDRNFNNSNYGDCLEKILNGNLGSGYKEWDYIDTKRMNMDNNNINKKIHAIGFIVDVVAMKQEENIKVIKEFLESIQNISKYRPLIIFTKCDTIMQRSLSEKQKPKLKDIYDSEPLRQAIEYFVKEVPFVEESDIMLFSNYTAKYDAKEERDYERELLLLHILDTLKERAEGFVRSYFENYVKVVDENDEYIGDFPFKAFSDRLADYEVQFMNILRDLKLPVDTNFKIQYENDKGRLTTESRSELFRNRSPTELQDVWTKEDGFSKIKILLKSTRDVSSEPTNTIRMETSNSNIRTSDLQNSQSVFNAEKNTTDIYLCFAPELETSKKKVKCRSHETLKDIRKRSNFPANGIFSKQSIGQEGFFTDIEEMEIPAIRAMDSGNCLHIVPLPRLVTPTPQTPINDKVSVFFLNLYLFSLLDILLLLLLFIYKTS